MGVMPERTVADRYRLERPIGRGGIGVVWLARDRLLEREVAIKEISYPDTLAEHERESLRDTVLREARAAARLIHPTVATVYDVLSEHGRTFIVSQLITAPTLDEIVAKWGPLPPERVARIGLQVASALDAAHQIGIVHGDVRPANVMVAADGTVWLADFGTASLERDRRLSAGGLAVNSPVYMAPEQARGADIGPEVDLWGLGATMYYAVEGQAPFVRASSFATMAAVVNPPPPPPRRADALAPVIMSLLTGDPRARPTLRQVRIRLSRVAAAAQEPAAVRAAIPVTLHDLFTPALTGPLPAERATHDTSESEARAAPATRPGRRGWTGARPWRVALVLLAAVAAVVLAVALSGRLRGGETGGGRAATPTHLTRTSTPTTSPAVSTAPPTTTPQTGASRTTSPPRQPPESQPPAGAASGVPAGWTRFSNPSGGYAVAYPSGWRLSTGLARHGTSFSEGTGRYLKVESAHPPEVTASGDPLPGWQQNEQYWSQRLPGYRLIGSVRRGSYHGMRAAVWEYTYVRNGRLTHGLNISFVSPSGSWGYSVLHLIPQDRWASSQGLIGSFEQAFSPLG
jgi:eukaryotic-like serine/threonine-protein kinase